MTETTAPVATAPSAPTAQPAPVQQHASDALARRAAAPAVAAEDPKLAIAAAPGIQGVPDPTGITTESADDSSAEGLRRRLKGTEARLTKLGEEAAAAREEAAAAKRDRDERDRYWAGQFGQVQQTLLAQQQQQQAATIEGQLSARRQQLLDQGLADDLIESIVADKRDALQSKATAAQLLPKAQQAELREQREIAIRGEISAQVARAKKLGVDISLDEREILRDKTLLPVEHPLAPKQLIDLVADRAADAIVAAQLAKRADAQDQLAERGDHAMPVASPPALSDAEAWNLFKTRHPSMAGNRIHTEGPTASETWYARFRAKGYVR